MDYKELLNQFNQLSATDQMLLMTSMQNIQKSELEEVITEFREANINKRICVFCKSVKVYKMGVVKGIQRYRCCECNKYFNSNHGTAIYYLKKQEKWNAYLKLMNQGLSIRKIATELSISIQTSFDWRHKVLASMKMALPETIQGVIECDEMVMPESSKGSKKLDRKPRKRSGDAQRYKSKKVSIITAVSRGSGALIEVIDAKKIKGNHVAKALKGKIQAKSTVITDENPSYNVIKREFENVEHKTINSWKNKREKPVNGIHIQTVNNQHKQIKDFLQKFNGVATKYLPNYLNWFLYNQKEKDNMAKVKDLLKNTVASSLALTFLADIRNFNVLIGT